MTKKIFHSILLVAGTVLLASLLVIMGCLYEYFGSVEKKQLRDELELAAVAVKENGTEYLSQLSSERYRLTWIDADGTVLYDTARARARAIPRRCCKRRCTARKGSRTGACCAFR